MTPKQKLENINTNFKILELLYISRICDHKNLLYVIKSLRNLSKNINGKIELNIFGLIEEEEYWKSVKKKLFPYLVL